MERFDEQPFEDTRILPEAPNTLPGILDPEAAIAAARRMQRWYTSTPQGAAHSQFGRDGRRINSRPEVMFSGDSGEDA